MPGKRIFLFLCPRQCLKARPTDTFPAPIATPSIKDDSHAEGGQKAADKRVNCATCHREGGERIQAGPPFQDDHEGDGEGRQLL